MTSETGPDLHVVAIRYHGHEPTPAGADPVDHLAEPAAFAAFGEVTVVEPRFPEGRREEEATINLGLIGGEIAAAVAKGRRAARPVVVVGGDCNVVPGVVGGLQEAHGAGARIGLVWFDAHGDFNTPKTTITGRLGGMPVAVAAGLAFAPWRALSRQATPLPTDRIVMVDVRNLDPAEEQLIRATDVVIAAPAAGFPGGDLGAAVRDLADRCDFIYLHVDCDILDERFVPNHPTKEPHGPDVEQVLAALETVLATGKVAVLAIVSVWPDGEGGDIAIGSGRRLLDGGLASWRRHGAVTTSR